MAASASAAQLRFDSLLSSGLVFRSNDLVLLHLCILRVEEGRIDDCRKGHSKEKNREEEEEEHGSLLRVDRFTVAFFLPAEHRSATRRCRRMFQHASTFTDAA